MNQNDIILNHLKRTGRITQRQAIMDYSVQSLTKRISELRDFGHNIVTIIKNHPVTKQRYAEFNYHPPVSVKQTRRNSRLPAMA
jgi:hypothetical protein